MGVSDVNMEEGSLRMDANVSIRPAGEATLGTKTELKNMNSFRFLERGIVAEIERQEAILREGGEVEQETLHFDPRSGSLSSLRSKEEAHDYRYFPEPDLVPLAPTEAMLARAREALPELPAARAERLERELGIAAAGARLLAFRAELGDLLEAAVAAGGAEPRSLANWIVNEVAAQRGRRRAWPTPASSRRPWPGSWRWSRRRRWPSRRPRRCSASWSSSGGDPDAIVEARGLGRAGSDELEQIVERAMTENADAVEKIRAGNDKAIGAVVGAVMRETKGRADGGEVQRMIRERI